MQGVHFLRNTQWNKMIVDHKITSWEDESHRGRRCQAVRREYLCMCSDTRHDPTGVEVEHFVFREGLADHQRRLRVRLQEKLTLTICDSKKPLACRRRTLRIAGDSSPVKNFISLDTVISVSMSPRVAA